MIVAVIAGNIGAGKSTTLNALSRLLEFVGVCFVYEPVEEWRTMGYLEEFYKTGNAFEFQLCVLYSRISAFEKAMVEYRESHNGSDPEVVVLDRWFAEDREFALVNYTRGAMTKTQFSIYETAYAYLTKHYPMPHISLWLDVAPEKCLQRLTERGRPEEIAGITLEYLQELDKAKIHYNHTIAVQQQDPLEVAMAVASVILPS